MQGQGHSDMKCISKLRKKFTKSLNNRDEYQWIDDTICDNLMLNMLIDLDLFVSRHGEKEKKNFFFQRGKDGKEARHKVAVPADLLSSILIVEF